MDLSSLPSLFLFFFLFPLSIYGFFFFLSRYSSSKKSTTKGVLKPYPLIGHLPQFIKNRHRFLEWTTEIIIRNPTHTMGFQSPGQTSGIITANPSNVQHMLKTNFENYPKGDRSITILQDFLGHGIFNSDGEQWKEQRKTASYEFNKRSLRNFVMSTVREEIEERLLPLLRRAEEEEETVDLQDALERFGFDNVCKVAFNQDPGSLAEKTTAARKASVGFVKAFGDTQDFIVQRFMEALPFTWRIKKLLNIGSEKRLKESISIVHDFAMKIIKSRKEMAIMLEVEDEDLLSRFAANKGYTEEYLRDNIINFILAGRETTSSALTWFFWILSSRPDVEKKIIEELKSIRQLISPQISSETYSFDELREMHYLHAAITESMRLYPAVPIDTQSCKDDDVMPDGTFVGKGWFVTYSAFAMGRLEEIWGKDCTDYKPERWLDKDGMFKPESPFRYPVFHAGPRMCLGKEMAYIQMKSVVASMVEQFEIDVMVDKNKTPEHVLSLTLKMKQGLPIRVRKRSNVNC